MDSVEEQVLDSWLRHHRINAYFLDHLSESHLGERLDRKGKSIAELFAHMHQVRRMWLQVSAPSLWEETAGMDKKQIFYKPYLKERLNDSAQSIHSLLSMGLKEHKIKGFKAGPVNFLSYLIAHESHHRGQAISMLRANGYELSEDLAYGIWDWGKR